MTKVYKNIGTLIVEIPYVGIFEPGEEKEVEVEINHPDFEEVKKPSQAKKEEPKEE